MESPTFPATRFVSAGASQSELDALTTLFETSDLGLQGALVDQWAALSAGGLIGYLETMRADNFFPTIVTQNATADTFDTAEPAKALDATADDVDETTSESENDHEGAEAAETPSD